MSSFSSTSRHITFTKKVGTFTSFISCDLGDIYVDYKEEGVFNDSNYTPLFSPTNTRVLEMNITNSMGVPFAVQSAVWKVNGQDVATTPGLSSIYQGGYDSSNNNTPTLTIKGSIAAASLNQSITILCEATVGYNQTETTIVRATYQIPVRQTSAAVWHVTIAAVDAESNYTINNGEYIDVKCIVFNPQGQAESPSQFKYEWYKMQAGTWQLKQTYNGTEQLRVYRDDIDNQALYMVKVYAPLTGGSGYASEPLGMDTQVLYDAMDEYTILVTPSNAEENIEEGVCEQIDYKVKVWNLNEQRNAVKADISFYLHDAAGVLINSVTDMKWENSSKSSPSGNPTTYGYNCDMFSVTLDNAVDAGGSLILDITAKIDEG